MADGSFAPQRIPLTVVGGFLGAGKTTLVNRILAGVGAIRTAVLVNDFGSINVDAALIAEHEGETLSLANGCLCCSIGGDLAGALVDVMSRTPAPQWIVIEASGVADPWPIAQVALADPGLALDGVVVLVDCAAASAQLGDPLLQDALARQLRAADVVVLNKRDLADDAQARELRERIAAMAPAAPVLEAIGSEVPLEALTSLAPHGVARASAGPVAEADHAARFESVTLAYEGRFHAARLRALLAHMPDGVLRAKGVVRTDEADAEVLQFCGRHGSLRSLDGNAGDEIGCIVAIGLRGRLPAASLRPALAGALVGAQA